MLGRALRISFGTLSRSSAFPLARFLMLKSYTSLVNWGAML